MFIINFRVLKSLIHTIAHVFFLKPEPLEDQFFLSVYLDTIWLQKTILHYILEFTITSLVMLRVFTNLYLILIS